MCSLLSSKSFVLDSMFVEETETETAIGAAAGTVAVIGTILVGRANELNEEIMTTDDVGVCVCVGVCESVCELLLELELEEEEEEEVEDMIRRKSKGKKLLRKT